MRSGKNVRFSLARMAWLFSAILILCSLIVGTVAQAVEVGDKAPDFTLPSSKGDPISLNQFLGKKNVVLEFYVLDFTPT
jgi:cytochrome oxidase Cu insertion factor (SCO1/SenC/PrrC family)